MKHSPTSGEIWKAASKELEETKLFEKLLDDLLQLSGEGNKEIIQYAKEHIDSTHFHKQIGDYVYSVILDAAYQYFINPKSN